MINTGKPGKQEKIRKICQVYYCHEENYFCSCGSLLCRIKNGWICSRRVIHFKVLEEFCNWEISCCWMFSFTSFSLCTSVNILKSRERELYLSTWLGFSVRQSLHAWFQIRMYLQYACLSICVILLQCIMSLRNDYLMTIGFRLSILRAIVWQTNYRAYRVKGMKDLTMLFSGLSAWNATSLSPKESVFALHWDFFQVFWFISKVSSFFDGIGFVPFRTPVVLKNIAGGVRMFYLLRMVLIPFSGDRTSIRHAFHGASVHRRAPSWKWNQ